MWRRLKPPKVDMEEYHAKICMSLIIEFRDYNTNPFDEEVRLSDFHLQQFRDYIQSKIITEI